MVISPFQDAQAMSFQTSPITGNTNTASGTVIPDQSTNNQGNWQDEAITCAISGGTTGAVLGLAFDGPGAVVCGLAGAGIGGVVGWIMGYFSSASGGNSAGELAMRSYYASLLANQTNYGLAWAHTNAYNVNQVVPDTQLYMARNAEWAAKQLYDYQTLHNQSHVWNPSYVYDNSLVCNATLADIWQTAMNYNSVLNLFTTLSNQFTGTYASMEWAYSTSVSATYQQFGAGSYGRIQVGMAISISNTSHFIDISDKMPIWIMDATGAASKADTITLTDSSGSGNSVDIPAMAANGIYPITLSQLGLKSGRYSITSANATEYSAFGIFGSDPITGNKAYPAILETNDDQGNEVVVKLIINYPGVSWANPIILIGTQGTGTGQQQIALGNKQIWNDMSASSSECDNLATTALSYGQTYFNQVVAANGNVPTPWADIVMPDPDQIANMNQSQLVALFYAYLNTMKTWFLTSTILTPGNITTTTGLNLLVRGAVYNNLGHEVIGNQTIYTPYFMTAAQQIKLGWNNLTQAGMIGTWYNARTIVGSNTTANFTYVEFSTGWRMHVDEMLYNGSPVSSVNLTLHTWDFIINGDLNSTHPPGVLSDLDWIIAHWYYIAAIVGIIMALAWIPTRSNAIGIIGILLIIVAAAGWYLAGDHSILSLFSGLGLNLWGK